MKKLLFLMAVISAIPLFAQTSQNNSSLTLEKIMKGEEFVGFLPENVQWSDDNQTIYFSWNPSMDTLRSDYKIKLNDKSPKLVNEDELKNRTSSGIYNKDRSKKVYQKNGDIFLITIKSREIIQITNTLNREFNPIFSGDEQSIIFQSGDNLFSWNISIGSTKQLTDFQSGAKPEESENTNMEQWLENDQLANFVILQKREAESKSREYRNDLTKPKRPLTIYTGQKSINNISVCPDLKYVVYQLVKNAGNNGTKVPSYVTKSGYINTLNSRPKVGSPYSDYETWIYSLEGDSTFKVSTENIEGIKDKPEFLKEYYKGKDDYNDQYEKSREVVINGPIFSDDSKAIVVIRSLDNKDRWIMSLNLRDGELSLLDHQRDEAWIGGPGIESWNYWQGNIGWLDNHSIWFQSEETGFSHLYAMNVATGDKTALTRGKFEINQAQLSNDKRYFYITSNMKSPHVRHFYKMSVKGGEMEQITNGDGNHEVSLSPDEKNLAIRYSFSNKPWELYLMSNKSGSKMEKITFSNTEEFREYNWRAPEIIKFTAEDGVHVPARIYQPDGDKKNGAAIIFVHGAGYLQNVHSWWSSYDKEYMFHNLLADNGYTVLDIDYRASSGYGRDWRTGIYRWMGGKDLSDHIDGAKHLVEVYNIDQDRIGIYGGSYGGFITLMALFTAPGTFKSGAALRSVTDWAHYNQFYTSNILNTPVEDSIAYYRSSPIYHAKGLQDNLLMLHGVVDGNVQFQDVVRLSQRLIELGKDNWELAIFPLEGHGFIESISWTDEYKRIFKLFQNTLNPE